MSTVKFRLMGIAFILLSVFAIQGLDAQGNPAPGCPQRISNQPCIQVIVFARNPGNGRCCQFANPCSVPPGFEGPFFTLEECEAATE